MIKTRKQVVEAINNAKGDNCVNQYGVSAIGEAERLAAYYACSGTIEDADINLRFLADSGASFNFAAAYYLSQNYTDDVEGLASCCTGK
jgi:hypothetical protein